MKRSIVSIMALCMAAASVVPLASCTQQEVQRSLDTAFSAMAEVQRQEKVSQELYARMDAKLSEDALSSYWHGRVDQVDRVKRIGEYIVQRGKAEGFIREKTNFSFTLNGQAVINAWAVPGGAIYVTRSLAEHSDDDMLALVLGHEISHVVKNHGYQRVALVVAALIGLESYAQRAEVTERQAAELIAEFGIAAHSRVGESEADLYGAKLAAYSGFNPIRGAEIFQLFADMGSRPATFVDEAFASHPDPLRRKRRIIEEAKDRGYTAIGEDNKNGWEEYQQEHER